MNYLAHARLSFNIPEILVGNLISDFVKGRKKFTYSTGIQKGIALHRAIDGFTDDHPSTKAARLFFKPTYRLYSGAFIDIVYDHFLANDTTEFVFPGDLTNFSRKVYETLNEFLPQLPDDFRYLFSFMKQQDWLSNYRHRWGIERSFRGLVNRAAYLSESATAFSIFNEHYEELKKCYNEFFPEQKQFAAQQLGNL
jgi:acyl carrier protein phosphodiesterase